MAYKEVTSGLTDVNAVINEILTFLTTDLAAPWTTETNKNPAAAPVTSVFTGLTGRNTWVSHVLAQPKGIAHNGIISPDPDRMYIGMRNISTGGGGLQFNGTGFHNAAASPVGAFRTGQGNLLEARPADDSATTVAVPYSDFEGAGPYTKLYLFGPNQVSPLDPLIPNYVYFVLEFEPGRYAHGMFGEFKKFTNWEGGWGFAGHSQNGTDTADNANNHTMWNEKKTPSNGDLWVAANVGQVSKTAGGPTRWFRSFFAMTAGGTSAINVPYTLRQWGHLQHRDFMTGPSQATLSGFFPLVQPIITLCDSDSTAGKNINDSLQDRMPACYPEDFFLGDITNFAPGVEVTVGGIPVVPFPATSKLGTSPRSTFGGYFYRKRV